MKKAGGALTARTVATARHPGIPARPIRQGDGAGLYLQITPSGSKSWLFRFTLAGRAREMGLGPAGEPPRGVPLAEARRLAAEASARLRQGVDPIDHRAAAQRREEADRRRAAAHTFRGMAEEMIDAREMGWRNAKHRAQWRSTLASYAFPAIGDMPVAEIGTDDVLRVLRLIWMAKPETASRLRGRIERVLAYAKTRGLRTGDNPAAWRGHLAESLPSPRRIEGKAPGHHAALPWAEIGGFMTELRARPAVAARALEFAILTAARTSEVLGARWREIDLDLGLWIVPAGRMKARREHRVPLSPAALDLLRNLLPGATGPDGYVFPGQERGSGLSNMALLGLLRRMNAGAEGGARWHDGRTGEAITTHGFRSTFRDWCGEASTHPADLAEAALAHVTRDKTEAAYARGDLFAKRTVLMADWAAFCAKPPVAVVRLRQEAMG